MVRREAQLRHELVPVLGDDGESVPLGGEAESSMSLDVDGGSELIDRPRRQRLQCALLFAALASATCVYTATQLRLGRLGRASVGTRRSCSVFETDAVGGGADDTFALQRLLDDSSCAEIVFPSNHTFSASQLFVRRSHLTLVLERNATLAGLPAAFLAARPDCETEAGLEFNWTHWCALLRVTATSHFTLRGEGSIEPGGVGGARPDFYSAVHVRSTAHVSFARVRVHCTAWWWCVVMHNASDVAVTDGFFVDGRAGRDGLDLVNCRRVRIEDARIEGNDDALCFKTISNGGLGGHDSRDVLVRNVTLGSTWCNAIQFGSATEVDLTNFTFRDVRVRFARKAAISIVSMDGARLSRLSFERVLIDGRDVASPLFVKLGNRAACEDGKGTCWQPGAIGDVRLINVTAVGWGNVRHPKPGHGRAYMATIEGLNASHRVGPVRIEGLTLLAPGRGTADDAGVDPPLWALHYQPRYEGVRPAYGLFVRHAQGVTIGASSIGVASEASEGRAAIVIDDVQGGQLRRVNLSTPKLPEDAQRAPGTCQVQVRRSSGNWSDGGSLRTCTWMPAPRPSTF